VTLAIYSFLESQFSPSQATRSQMRQYLVDQFSKENKDVAVSLND
jgi:hypothetical protein